jgi:peroxiredoxin
VAETPAAPREPGAPFLIRHAKPVSAILIVVLIAAGIGVAILADSGTAPPPKEFGDEAPDFEVTTLGGVTLRLSDELAAGRVVVIDFMFVNCPPCRIEMEHLVELRDTFPSSQVTIITLDLQPETETEEELAAFRDEFQANWHFAFDTDGVIRLQYRVSVYPSVMIVAPNGRIAFSAEGITTAEFLVSEVESLL